MRNFLTWLPADWHWAVLLAIFIGCCLVAAGLGGLWWCAREAIWWVQDWWDKRRELVEQFDAELEEVMPADSVWTNLHLVSEPDLSSRVTGGGLGDWRDQTAAQLAPEREWDFAAWELEQANWVADMHADALRVQEALTSGDWADPWWIKQAA